MTKTLLELPLVLSVEEVSEVLRIGRNHIYDLARCGKLRSIRVGRKILIPRTALEEFLSGSVN